jgi:chromosome partitioning protein
LKIITLANQKGGVGKTTSVLNLGAALAQMGFKTLIVDSDPQGNATSGLGFDKRSFSPSIYNVLVDLLPIDKVIRPTSVPNLFLAGSGKDLAGAEVELVPAMARESRLKGSFAAIKEQFEFVLIDCPPSLGLLTVNALTAATHVLIPIQGEYYALEGLAQFVDTIHLVKKSLNPHLDFLGCFLTLFDSRMSLAQQVQEEVKKFMKEKLFKTIIPRSIRLAEAPGFGKTIFEHDPKSRGAQAYLDLMREILAHMEYLCVLDSVSGVSSERDSVVLGESA